jgi:hypothetical protein
VLTQGFLPLTKNPEVVAAVPGGPGFLILGAYDFKPGEQTASYHYNGAQLNNPGTLPAWYMAPVHLPQGVTVNQLVAYFYDNDSGDTKNIMVRLWQDDILAVTLSKMAQISSTGALPYITPMVTATIDYPIIDNSMYAYIVEVILPNSGSIYFTGVRIDYTYSASLPAVAR